MVEALRQIAEERMGGPVAGMPTVPAAGIPMAAIDGDAVAAYIRSARSAASAASRAAAVPSVLAQPAALDDLGPIRRYRGFGLALDLERDPETGLWILVSILDGEGREKRAALTEDANGRRHEPAGSPNGGQYAAEGSGDGPANGPANEGSVPEPTRANTAVGRPSPAKELGSWKERRRSIMRTAWRGTARCASKGWEIAVSGRTIGHTLWASADDDTCDMLHNLRALIERCELVHTEPYDEVSDDVLGVHRMGAHLKLGARTIPVKLTVFEYSDPGTQRRVYHAEVVQ